MSETSTPLPEWLTVLPDDDPIPKYPRTKDEREIREITFHSIFERVLESLEAGEPASRTIKDDPRGIDVGQFMSWVRRDTERFARFQDAKQNGMLILEDKLIEIAEGAESTEDVQRSKLRADTIKWIMQSWDKRYKANDNTQGSAFSGGITVVIGEVDSPYAKRDPITIENKS